MFASAAWDSVSVWELHSRGCPKENLSVLSYVVERLGVPLCTYGSSIFSNHSPIEPPVTFDHRNSCADMEWILSELCERMRVVCVLVRMEYTPV